MIIFNSTDHPIAVFLYNRSVVIEAGRYYEDPLIEGEYEFRAYKLRKNGKPLSYFGKNDEDWGAMMHRYHLCLGVSGKLMAERDCKLHIREKYRNFFGFSNNKSELECLECIVENGKLQNVQNYFPASHWPKRELYRCYFMLGFFILCNLAMLSIPQYDLSTFALKFLFQGLFLFLDWECIRTIRILRKYPIRSETEVIQKDERN
jgi:hypothetical protein